MHVLTLIALALPSFITRFFLFREKDLLKGLEDLFIGALYLYLYSLFSYFSFGVIFLLELLILSDMYLQYKLNLRLELGFCSLLLNASEFVDSIHELCMFQWLSLFFILSLSPVFVLLIYPPSFSFWSLCLLAIPLLNWKNGESFILLYYLRNIRLRRSKGEIDQSHFIPKNEIYQKFSPKYPLYRYTNKFLGEKAFQIDLKKREKPHVVFLFVESLRQQDLGKNSLTPNLDKLVNRGVTFPNFYSNSLETFRCIYSTLFGIPYALKFEPSIDLNLPLTGLIDLLKLQGYQTNFINAASWSLNNLRQFLDRSGADVIIDKKDIRDFYGQTDENSWGVFDEYFFKYALEHQKSNHQTPQFYSLSTITMHHPYRLPSNYKSEHPGNTDHERYLQTLSYTDRCIGEYIKGLKEAGLLKNTLFFIMGDHGVNVEKAGDITLFSKRERVSSFNVPLIIYGEGLVQEGLKVKTPGSHTDLVPTLMDMLGIKGSHLSIGKSLLRKGSKHPIFLMNSSNPRKDIFIKQGDETKSHLNHEVELANSFIHFFDSLYEKRNFMPKKGKHAHSTFEVKGAVSEPELIDQIERAAPLGYVRLNNVDNVTDKVLEVIANTSAELCLLQIDGNREVTDLEISKIVECCPYLMSLNISRCPLLTTNSLSLIFNKLLDLDTLLLEEFSSIECSILKKIKKHQSLMFLSVSQAPLTQLSLLSSLFPNLYSLRLSYREEYKDSLPNVIHSLPIHSIEIEDCYTLDDKTFSGLLKANKQLKFMLLRDCAQVTDQGFMLNAETALNMLELYSPLKMTDKGLKSLLQSHIEHIYIGGEARTTFRPENVPVFGPSRFPKRKLVANK